MGAKEIPDLVGKRSGVIDVLLSCLEVLLVFRWASGKIGTGYQLSYCAG
ncbi:hypothetical Protein YC6258_03079 [Gynuella sunshinyii YC6258]|uniref:Uncharacterized protein n=1 Tax=Gynuella sunshinyii YC6258 TaxID=1445510 RepID=A0A0C5V6Q0_9GAMM|nr:hypothetical Protein YC6258_03079 [Gynuella sunshinyii YC6258]